MRSLSYAEFVLSPRDRIRERRVARGPTQEQLGQQCDLHQMSIGSVGAGRGGATLGIPSPMSDVSRILSAIEAGDPRAAEQLLPLVYDELARMS